MFPGACFGSVGSFGSAADEQEQDHVAPTESSDRSHDADNLQCVAPDCARPLMDHTQWTLLCSFIGRRETSMCYCRWSARAELA